MNERAAGVAGDDRRGLLFGVGAYLTWGLIPIYLRALRPAEPLEILAHRVLWSLLLLLLLLAPLRRQAALGAAFRTPRTRRMLAATAALIAVNWLIYIWAVNSGHLLQASLGYFINPLLNVALGVVVLGERLRRIQAAAVALATIGVAYLGISTGEPPWIALALATSFALYGLIRKLAAADAFAGLTFETALLAPLSLAYLVALAWSGEGQFGSGLAPDLLLAGSGVVTALPLLMFAAAANRLRLATLGLLQFISPSLQFLLALAYGERVTTAHVITFGFIWTGLVLFAVDGYRETRALRSA